MLTPSELSQEIRQKKTFESQGVEIIDFIQYHAIEVESRILIEKLIVLSRPVLAVLLRIELSHENLMVCD